MDLYDIAAAPSAQRIYADIETLVGFGTRHTASETQSDTRGIGAARRWIFAEFERISAACGGCLEVITISDAWVNWASPVSLPSPGQNRSPPTK
jgi:hypothetical protein